MEQFLFWYININLIHIQTKLYLKHRTDTHSDSHFVSDMTADMSAKSVVVHRYHQ